MIKPQARETALRNCSIERHCGAGVPISGPECRNSDTTEHGAGVALWGNIGTGSGKVFPHYFTRHLSSVVSL